MTRNKKIFLNGTALLISSYISILFTLGIVSGYLITNRLNKRFFAHQGMFLPFWKKWKIHFHHWIMGSLGFLIFHLLGIFEFIPNILLGALMGFTIHDFMVDKEWYKIFQKKEEKFFSHLKIPDNV